MTLHISINWYFLIYLEIVNNFKFSAQKDKLQTRYVSFRSLSSRQWSSTCLFGNAHRHGLGISHPEKNPVLGISPWCWCSSKISFKVLRVSTFMGPMWQHSLNFIATTRDEHNMCAVIVFLLKNSSAIRRTMLQLWENDGTPESDLNIFFLYAEKELGSALKNRVGRETGNTGIILYGLVVTIFGWNSEQY